MSILGAVTKHPGGKGGTSAGVLTQQRLGLSLNSVMFSPADAQLRICRRR